jgi:hypothetical protein
VNRVEIEAKRADSESHLESDMERLKAQIEKRLDRHVESLNQIHQQMGQPDFTDDFRGDLAAFDAAVCTAIESDDLDDLDRVIDAFEVAIAKQGNVDFEPNEHANDRSLF